MAWRGVWHGSIGAMAGMLVAGCTQTSRVDDNLSTASLAETKKAVAVMRVGAASPSCINVAVLLGVREGEGFRRHQGITVMNVRSLVEPAVAEVELDPGEYHVACLSLPDRKGGIKTVADGAGRAPTAPAMRASRCRPARSSTSATCTSTPGARAARRSAGRCEVDVEVTDWPLAELDRFKAKRPHIYAQMKTRLMTVTPQGQGAADEPGVRAAQGAARPRARCSSCRPNVPAPAAAKRTAAAVAKSGGS